MKQRYHVHIYREMRLYFPGIEADSSEAAAELARNLPTADAAYTEDCDGRTLAALVDLDGDTEYEHTIDIDFDKRPEGPGTVVPTVVVVSVRGGIVEDIDATCPLTAIVEDWDALDILDDERPARNVIGIEKPMSSQKRDRLITLLKQPN